MNKKLLQNAINSIEVGIEDYELSKQDERRIISCVRNVFAGILLLFKYKLVELSPANSDEVLIKQQILWVMENGNIIAKGKGNKTVDVQSIKDRFKSLNISIDWENLDRINSYRNNIEHYYSELSISAVQEMIAMSFPIINNFIRNNLGDDPEELFSKDTWERLLSIKSVYDNEKKSCLNNLKRVNFYNEEIYETISNHKCSKCGYGLITVDDEDDGKSYDASCQIYRCKSCNKTWDYEDLGRECLYEKYKDEWWECRRYGGEAPVVTCPFCEGQYDYIENICYSCGNKADGICQNCGSNIPASELMFYPLCGYCDYVFEKLREE